MNVRTLDPALDQFQLFTIGYEGRTIKEYVDMLLGRDIALVVDVRKNPLSRKKGFSKKALSAALSDAGIAYRHLPSLGIDSSLRKNLRTPEDYQALFRHYETEILPENQLGIAEIEELLIRFDRIALTCFERDHGSCHRNCVAKAFEGRYPIINL